MPRTALRVLRGAYWTNDDTCGRFSAMELRPSEYSQIGSLLLPAFLYRLAGPLRPIIRVLARSCVSELPY